MASLREVSELEMRKGFIEIHQHYFQYKHLGRVEKYFLIRKL